VLVLILVACFAAAAADAAAQVLPSEPLSIGNGRVVIGAEVSVTFGSEDPGFFNYTDYEYNALRNVRFGVTAEVRASSRFQVLGELRIDHGDAVQPYALYVRVRPWPDRRFDLQVGRVPPTFGAFTRSAYAYSNVLVGQPLAYQYLLSPQSDAIPATADDLLRMRGRGWFSSFPVGNPLPGPGLPVVNTARWDTGVQAHGVNGIVEWTGSVTVGSLSNPRVRDDNTGRQLAGRVILRPTAAWQLGASASRGAWLDRSIDRDLTPPATTADGVQTAFGWDAEYSTGPVLIRGEVIRSQWTLPAVAAPQIDAPLVALSVMVEGRYRLAPGFYLAARGEEISFGQIGGAARSNTWEADLWRVEVGPGLSITRNVLLKGSWQRNRRQGGAVRHDTLVAGQMVYWF
jgi:hypothetical protein